MVAGVQVWLHNDIRIGMIVDGLAAYGFVGFAGSLPLGTPNNFAQIDIIKKWSKDRKYRRNN